MIAVPMKRTPIILLGSKTFFFLVPSEMTTEKGAVILFFLGIELRVKLWNFALIGFHDLKFIFREVSKAV